MILNISMKIEDDEGGVCEIKEVFDVDESEDAIDDVITSMAQRLISGYGYPEDVAHQIYNMGWERLAREQPYVKQPKYLVAYKSGKFLMSDVDEWDGEKFKKYGDKVVFWTYLPNHESIWSNDPEENMQGKCVLGVTTILKGGV